MFVKNKKPGVSERELLSSSNSFTPGTRFHRLLKSVRALSESMNYEVLYKSNHKRNIRFAIIDSPFPQG